MSDSTSPGSAALRLVLGAAQIGQKYGATNRAGRPDLATVAAIIRAASRHGISHLDTARAYGESESDLGRTMEVGRPYVITKIAPLGSGDAGDAVLHSWQSSRASLATKASDVTDLLFHRAIDLRRHRAWETLRRIKDSVGIARIGASVQSPAELSFALTMPEIAHVQIPFNILDQRWLDPVVLDQLASRPDVVVVARSTYLQGLLLTTDGWPPGHDSLRYLEMIDSLAIETGSMSRAEFCVRFALSHPAVNALVIGAENSEQLEENARLAGLPPLSTDAIEDLLDRFDPAPLELIDPSRWWK